MMTNRIREHLKDGSSPTNLLASLDEENQSLMTEVLVLRASEGILADENLRLNTTIDNLTGETQALESALRREARECLAACWIAVIVANFAALEFLFIVGREALLSFFD